jgi:hypothetical protein
MMKKLLAYILCLSLVALPFPATFAQTFDDGIVPLRVVASGIVTQANMKISAVDGGATASGGAFIDFSASDILTTKLGHLVRIKDSSNRVIQGYIKAAGSGETLDATNLVTEWTNVNYDTFTSVASPDIAAAVYTTSGTQTGTSNSMVTTAGKLYKLVATWTNVAGEAPTLTGTNGFVTTILGAGANNIYFTATGTSVVLTVTNTAAASWGCTFVLKQVTVPANTGVTIVSTKGGATYNFAQKNSAFNYNDASGYTYEILKTPAVVVASGSISAGAALLDTTTANAFYGGGVDLTAYQDGRHAIAFYQASGMAWAWISATAPSGLATSAVYTSDFSIGVDGWSASNGTVTGNIDAIGSEDDWLRLYANATSGNHQGIKAPLTVGAYYTVAGKTYIANSGGSTYLNGISLQNNTSSAGGQPGVITSTTGSVVNLSFSFTAITTALRWYLSKSTSYSFVGANSATDDVAYLKSIVATQTTMPAATGALLLSTKAGSRGWIQNTGVTGNEALTYKVYMQ